MKSWIIAIIHPLMCHSTWLLFVQFCEAVFRVLLLGGLTSVSIDNITVLCLHERKEITHTHTHCNVRANLCDRSIVNSITVWGWVGLRWTSFWLPATFTCLTLYYCKLIKAPQVFNLSVCFTETSSTQAQLNLGNISDSPGSWVTSGVWRGSEQRA